MSERPDPRPISDPGDGNPVDELVFAALERIEREGPAAVEALCAEHPAHAREVRARIATLREAGLIEAGGPDASVPERLGDFRLRERLGAGGMGVVYRAEQISLRREVALKLVRPDQLYFDGARQRFAREVAAVARLSHPGIAAVHTVGEQDGVPFFAMELVRGASLAEALDVLRREGTPPARLCGRDLQRVLRLRAGAPDCPGVDLFEGSWVDTCLRIARRIAEALQHTHGHGVLHRDVKPSNVMMTPEGRVLLVDFGLASSSGVGRLTRTGAQLGSAPYMPPEVARGETVEPAVTMDVYSLGVTLYELLTLRLPFTADSTPRLLTAVAAGRRTPLRAHNHRVPPDVEIVCATAMDPDPDRRYRTAAALARDLDHALARRPIEAQPIGPALRLRRWAQRSPARAVAVGLAALLLLGGPSALAVQQSLARARLAAALALAEENFDAANEAVQSMLTEVASENLADVPRMDAVRRTLLERALEFHQRFLDQRSDDFDVRLRTAEAFYRVGGVRRLLGQMDAAAAAQEEAIGRLGALLEERPEHGRAWASLARARNALAYLRAAGGDVEDALGLFERLLDDLAQAMRHAPDDPSLVRYRVTALKNVGVAKTRLGEPEAALARLDEALEEIGGLVARGESPNDAFLQASLSQVKGTVLHRLGRDGQARRAQEAGVEMLRELVAREPGSRRYRLELASSRHNLALTVAKLGEGDRARELLATAIEGIRRLRADFPDETRIRRSLALALSDLSWLELEHGDDAAARSALEECLAEAHAVLGVTPNDARARTCLAKNQRRLVALLTRLGEHATLAEVAGAWVDVPWCDPPHLAFCASALARAVELVGSDAVLLPERRASLAADYRQRGLSLLRRAIEEGWRDAAALHEPPMTALEGDGLDELRAAVSTGDSRG